MQTKNDEEDKVIDCINCITGKTEVVIFKGGKVLRITEMGTKENDLAFIGPGLTDLQINGINGIDFNTTSLTDTSLTEQDFADATHYLLSWGVTTFLPTDVTNPDENILTIVHTIYEACRSNSFVDKYVWGIHLEGPFILPAEGAKRAHDKKYIKAPDWDLFNKFQEAVI